MALKKSAMRGCGSLFELLTSAFTSVVHRSVGEG